MSCSFPSRTSKHRYTTPAASTVRVEPPNNATQDEGRLEASGSITVGAVILSEDGVVRPSQELIASVGRALEG